jgi:hypothetical protein
MNNVVPNHLSHSLELDYKNRKRFLVDRVKIKRLVPGIVFGFLLFLLGLYEWFNAFRYGGEEIVPVEDISVYKPLLSVWFFDLCFIFVGLGIVVTNILLYIRYNKYKINFNDIFNNISDETFNEYKIIIADSNKEEIKFYLTSKEKESDITPMTICISPSTGLMTSMHLEPQNLVVDEIE